MTQPEDTSTPAHQAVGAEDAEILARLLGAGADPDEIDEGMTLLTRAIDVEGDSALQSGQPLTVHTTAVLLAFGADPELEDPAGHTPLAHTVIGGDANGGRHPTGTSASPSAVPRGAPRPSPVGAAQNVKTCGIL
ncbi:hypothetical protein ACFYXS_35220 [Streptomyces sp. NPDC002574]|uniref:hypothetical protein n=1 Tax=Streptomyces sp. NPDC002574 TaxID=3364652 RepID=UPI0036C68CBF